MATTNITLSDDSLLAEYVALDKFKGVLEQRLAVGPDTLAMLIRDGQIAEASAGGHFAIGGVWRTIKDAVAGRHALRLLIADLKPFQIITSANALTRDNVPVAAEFTIDLQVNPEKPANVLGLMREHSAVTKSSLMARLAPHLGDRVLEAAIRRQDATELRGNKGLQDMVQADAMKEVERVAGDLGLLVRAVSMRWALNEEELALVAKRKQEREQEALERDFQVLTREIEREAETTVVKLKADFDVEKMKTMTEADLRRLILGNELDFIDARETGVRIQQIKALQHELELNRTQRLDALKAQIEAEDHAIEMARKGGDKRAVGRGIERDDKVHDVDLTRIGGEKRDVQMSIVERERAHDVSVARLRSELRAVERSTEDLDKRQILALQKLDEMQKLDIAARAHEDQIRTMRGLQDVELDAEGRRLDLNIRGGDAAHRRKMEETQTEHQTILAKIQMLKDATPEQIMAINAGFSAQVANVMIEQAKARSAEGTDRLTLMREMIQQAQDARVASEAQARHLFDSGMRGATGVAQGVGNAVAGRPQADAPEAPPATADCPGCHRTIPVTDRHCRYCGRQMRQ